MSAWKGCVLQCSKEATALDVPPFRDRNPAKLKLRRLFPDCHWANNLTYIETIPKTFSSQTDRSVCATLSTRKRLATLCNHDDSIKGMYGID